MADVHHAPGDLEMVRSFVNTYDVEEDKDQVAEPEALAAWLREKGLLERGAKLRPADRRRAADLREALRDLMGANNGEPLRGDSLQAFNRAVERAKLQPALHHPAEWRFEPAATGIDRALGRILAISLEAMSDGTWARLKACSEHSCRWAFYDGSRNRSGTWCDMAVCGNRAKARAFRKRQKAAPRR